jgi:hypothetical protein
MSWSDNAGCRNARYAAGMAIITNYDGAALAAESGVIRQTIYRSRNIDRGFGDRQPLRFAFVNDN